MSASMCNYTQIASIFKLNMEHIVRWKKLVSNLKYTKVCKTEANLYLNCLLILGYFTILNTYGYKGKLIYNLTIPNKEMKNETLRNFNDGEFLKTTFLISDSAIHSYVEPLMDIENKKIF